jgi:hypothetical protein
MSVTCKPRTSLQEEWLGCFSFNGLLTLRFRQDLQFMDSLGSLLARRVGNRSMPTGGRAPETG